MLDLRPNGGLPMSKLTDVRRSVGAKVGSLTPANARAMAKDLLEPGAAKERVDKVTADLLEWSQRNTDRLREVVRREIAEQLSKAGLASQKDLDAVTKRVRALERAAASPAAKKRASAKATGAKATGAKATTATRATKA
jgi:polyhydroxyalkanoate synthesis regulator phasin